jgi:2-oxoglutarate dehydrogenase E2 component (dihydrolipoamide succinyltransferase)
MSDVVMPQMGESIAEGTIVRWIKNVGDRVDRDEPLFEISTDKVDAEIPSPSAGVIVEIRAKEGETVPVNSVVAVIGEAGAAVAASAAKAESTAPAPLAPAPPVPPVAPVAPAPAATAPAVPVAPPAPAAAEGAAEGLRQKSSPLVRRIAKEHRVDLSLVPGTGLGGRVTKEDILGYLNEGPRPATPKAAAPVPAPSQPAAHVPAFKPGDSVEVVPMSVMRRKIAEHMVLSRRTSAHVHSVFEVDYTRVAKIRAARKADYERQGVKLTYMSFLMKATVDALKAVPVVNTSINGDNIVYKRDINLGIAVALDWGLIVPVIKHAEEKNMLGLSRAIVDLAARARSKQLKPDEVQGGTFTITNPGVFGALFGMPIISQPQVAILGVGTIEKRVAVLDDDAIGVRTKGYLSIGYDHRLIDGAVADQFMSHLKKTIENFDPDAV